MESINKYHFTLHALPTDMGVILKYSIYCIVHQRGIDFAKGYKCGMYDGVPLMLPRSAKIKAYIDEVTSGLQGVIDKKEISKFIFYICAGDFLERWVFDLQLKEAYEETPCKGNAVPEMSDIVLKITSITCCLPLLNKRCRLYCIFERIRRDVDRFVNSKESIIQDSYGTDNAANIDDSAREYYIRSYPPDR